MTGNHLVRSVAIRSWGSLILEKRWLDRVSNFSIGLSSVRGVFWVLVEFMFFLIWLMCPFAVAIKGGRYFMRFTVRLGQVVKWKFLMSWNKVLLNRLKSGVWYHLARYGLILAARALSAAGCCWFGGWSELMVRLKCHMTDVFDRLTYNTVILSFTTLLWVAVDFAMKPSP